MSHTRSFTITTSGSRGPRCWWYVRIYPDLHTLRAAARTYDPSCDFTDAHAVCHTARNTTLHSDKAQFTAAGFTGVIRFAATHLGGEWVTHELIHAACAVYRKTVAEHIDLGTGVTDQEEQLAYIYGELYESLEAHFAHTLKPADPVT